MIHNLEAKIKTIIVKNANSGISQQETIKKLIKIILSHQKEFNKLDDSKEYTDSAKYWANIFVKKYYRTLNKYLPFLVGAIVSIKTQKDVPKKILTKIDKINSNSNYSQISKVLSDKEVYDYVLLGKPNLVHFDKEIKKEIDNLAKKNFGTIPVIDKNGKIYYGRSLFAKAERDLIFNEHLSKIQEFKSKGINTVWVTTHANCSKRCQPFQGKPYTLDGTYKTIRGYTLQPIEKAIDVYVTTKSGKVWRNGLFGFNCRHDIISFENNELPPMQYTEKQMVKYRELEKKQRTYERNLYQLDLQRAIYEQSNDALLIAKSKELYKRYKAKEQEYISFCHENKLANQPERYKIWLRN